MISAMHFLMFLCLGIWLGAVVMLSFVVAPTMFRVLTSDQSARLAESLFPRYYFLCEWCAGLFLPAWAIAFAFGEAPMVPALILLGLVIVAGVIAGYSRRSLTPRINAARMEARRDEPPASAKAAFDRLHHRSVRLNATMLFLLVAALAILSA